MNNTNNSAARESFIHAKKMFYKAWRGSFDSDQQCMDYVDSLKLSQSEIRLEVGLNATGTNFKFGLTQNQNNSTGLVFNTENRLTMQDSFCANEYAVTIGQPSSNTDTLWRQQTYPNTQVFAAADLPSLNGTFYSHGALRMTCNNDVIMPYRGLWNHYYAPQTQQTAALGAGSPQDQIRGAEDAFITDEPNIILIGSKGYIPEIILPVAMASVGAFMRAVLTFRGVLAQNSTSVS